ncbi:tumor protein 63-like [Latimeria chalumnae]|uniref:tumor protein 63-like n=1 Tax=Latimeria chalumnae TaxID=7897 RepID=UPI00313C1124
MNLETSPYSTLQYCHDPRFQRFIETPAHFSWTENYFHSTMSQNSETSNILTPDVSSDVLQHLLDKFQPMCSELPIELRFTEGPCGSAPTNSIEISMDYFRMHDSDITDPMWVS